jgi:anion-transporting  ArsA/GET3 family ATPase
LSAARLSGALATRRVVVCVGSGGVGKTTVAAALGVRAAMDGRKALVITVDPARRLANSLGLAAIGNVETRIADAQFRAAGLAPRGELYAMTLDVKRTWDELVARHAPSPERRDQILANKLYRRLSTALAGSQEYMAMEKVYELSGARDYDVVVVDTPPTAHALDFLHAPDRLLDVLDSDAARWLLTPALAAGKVGLRLFNLSGSYAAKTLARFTGVELLRDLAEFMIAFQGMYEGFKERAAEVKRLFGSEAAAFVLVTGPSPQATDEALFFHAALSEEGMPVASVVVNRVHPDPGPPAGEAELRAALARHGVADRGAPPLHARLRQSLADQAELFAGDRAQVERLRARVDADSEVVQVPRLLRDVHDLGGLWEIDRLLFG